jgi:hypothetical protein
LRDAEALQVGGVVGLGCADHIRTRSPQNHT